MMNFPRKTWRDISLHGKTVLLRVDYNIPISDSEEARNWRIKRSLPTVKMLIKNGAKVVIISHLGRPKGDIDPKLSLDGIAKDLTKMLEVEVGFVSDCIGDKVKIACKRMTNGDVLLLENLRFHKGEEENDPQFAAQLVKSSGAQVFIQDGYGVIHRAHASTDEITNFIPAVAGPLLVDEWVNIKTAVDNPNRPLVAVVGGAKIVDKTPLILRLIDKADYVIIGGAIANNFLVHEKFSVGASLWSPEADLAVNKILAQAKNKFAQNTKQHLILPIDLAVSVNGNKNGARKVVSRGGVKANNIIYDLGSKTINHISQIVEQAGTVIWNGTLGLTDKPNFAYASSRLALTLANNPQIYSLICGGDTVDFVRNWDSLDGGSFSYLSTGGGAALSQIAGEKLPGIEALL